MRLSLREIFKPSEPPTTAPLPRSEEVARDLRQWAYANTSDLAMLGEFLSATLKGFEAKTGTPHADVLEAADLIRRGADLHSRLLSWAFDHHAVKGRRRPRSRCPRAR